MLEFDAKDKTIEEILFSTKRYKVPEYQRPYSWGLEEVTEFMEDIESNDNTCFLGSLIFNTETIENDDALEIIDGQQRLITITLFMASIRDIYKEFDKEAADKIERQDITIETRRKGKDIKRIICGKDTQEFFELFQKGDSDLNNTPPNTKEKKKILDNYKFFKKEITIKLKECTTDENKIEILENLRDKVYKLKIIEITIKNREDAYEVFETVNARGVELSVSDLLKNLIFSKINKDKKSDRDSFNSMWEKIINNIKDTGEDLKRFIRYYWISKYEFVTEKKLFKKIKHDIKDYKKFLEDLVVASNDYRILLKPSNIEDWKNYENGDKIMKILVNLSIMKVNQCYVLFMSILRNYKKINTDKKNIFELIEKFTFQYSVISKLRTNILEHIYSKYAIEIEKAVIKKETTKKLSGEIQRIFSEIKKELIAIIPKEQDFTEEFNKLEYHNNEKARKLITYVLSKFDSQDSSGENKIDFENVNIEHIIPQKPKKNWKGLNEQNVKNYVHKIGNLVLISKKLNSSMGNDNINDKIKTLKKSEIKSTIHLAEYIEKNEGDKWNEEEILKRQKEMGNEAYNKIFKI